MIKPKAFLCALFLGLLAKSGLGQELKGIIEWQWGYTFMSTYYFPVLSNSWQWPRRISNNDQIGILAGGAIWPGQVNWILIVEIRFREELNYGGHSQI